MPTVGVILRALIWSVASLVVLANLAISWHNSCCNPEQKSLAKWALMSDIYTVEQIVNSRARNGKKQYLVKWEGYSSKDNTWEDEENIFCKELIYKYEEAQKRLKKEPRQDIKKEPASNTRKEPRMAAEVRRSSRPALSRTVTNEWHDLVKRVVSVEKDEKTGEILVMLLFNTGDKGKIPAHQAHTCCPLHLLEYYERNLVFGDEAE
jgi:chromobox protein 1